MLNQPMVIARKEVVDSLRDVRSVMSSSLFVLMGPLVVGLVSMANRTDAKQGSSGVLIGMMSVFTLVAAFVGGMNIAMDTVAGERERRSLLPLLLNPLRRLDVVIGKWLSVSFFSITGLTINLLGFALVFAIAGMHMPVAWPQFLLVVVLGFFPLALFAAAIELLISTMSRAAKEAQTYLSLIVFAPMGIGMFLVFFPTVARSWWGFLPVVGQLLQLQLLMNGRLVQLFQPILLGCLTAILAILVLLVTANRLERDEIIYGS
jgi:sodium transport system permease protein